MGSVVSDNADARVDDDAWYVDGMSDDADVWTNVVDVDSDSVGGNTREVAEVSGTVTDDEFDDIDGWVDCDVRGDSVGEGLEIMTVVSMLDGRVAEESERRSEVMEVLFFSGRAVACFKNIFCSSAWVNVDCNQ